jgi:hypothetical protein
METWAALAPLLARSLHGSEWASGGWCLDQWPHPYPPNARSRPRDLELPDSLLNRHVGNLVGFLRLARRCGQESSPPAALAWGRLARELALRLALAKYAVWLVPPDGPMPFTPSWRPNRGADQVRYMNQFEVNIWDHTQDWLGAVYVPFLDLTPEMGRFLARYVGRESAGFLKAVDRAWPHWYLANAGAEIGNDHAGLEQPDNAYSLFVAHAWIGKMPAAELQKRLDVSWLRRGDLFYLHKLAETIKAHRGTAGSR